MIGLYTTECTRREGLWRGVDDLELAALSWVHWLNETRLHGSIGHVPARGVRPPTTPAAARWWPQ